MLFTTSYTKKRKNWWCRNTGTDVLNAAVLSVNAQFRTYCWELAFCIIDLQNTGQMSAYRTAQTLSLSQWSGLMQDTNISSIPCYILYHTDSWGFLLVCFCAISISQYLRLLIFQVILIFTSSLSWFMLNNYFFGQLCCSCSSSSSKFFPYALIKWGLRTSCQNIHRSNPLGASES